MTEMMNDFTLNEDKLNEVNGGAFSDMETSALIVAEGGMLSSPGGRTRWQTMSHEDKVAKVNERAKTDKRTQAMVAAFGADVVVSMIDDSIN